MTNRNDNEPRWLADMRPLVDKRVRNFIELARQRTLPTNQWIKFNGSVLQVYLRCYRVPGALSDTLDIGNIDVTKRARSQGCFTMFLEEVERIADELSLVIRVECIFERRLWGFLERRGYVEATRNTVPPSFERQPFAKKMSVGAWVEMERQRRVKQS